MIHQDCDLLLEKRGKSKEIFLKERKKEREKKRERREKVFYFIHPPFRNKNKKIKNKIKKQKNKNLEEALSSKPNKQNRIFLFQFLFLLRNPRKENKA